MYFSIVKRSLFTAGIIALIIMFCAGERSFAARIAGVDENISTTNVPASSPEQPQVTTPKEISETKAADEAQPLKDVKSESVVQKPKEINAEGTKVKPAKKETSKKYVTIDFDNVDIGVLVKFVSELTGKNFIIDDKVRGKVTIISPKKYLLKMFTKCFYLFWKSTGLQLFLQET